MQTKISLKQYAMMIVMGIALTVGLNNILMVLNLAKYSEAYQRATEILYAPSLGKQILYTGLLIPMMEEIIFRAGVFKILRKWMSFVWAMLLSALLFGIYHGNLVQFVYAGICGLVLAHLYEKFQAIVAPMLLHMVMNLTACVLTEFHFFAWMFERSMRVTGITILCMVVFFIAFIQTQELDITKMLKKYCKE